MNSLHNPFARDHQLDEFTDTYLASLKPEVRTEIVERWFMRPKPIGGFKLMTYFFLGSGAVYVISEAISRIIIAAKSVPDVPQHSRPFMLATALADPAGNEAPADAPPAAEIPGHGFKSEATRAIKEAALVADVGKAATLAAELAL